jgi:hypothetical protein
MKIFNKEAKVLVPNKTYVSLSQKVFFSYILIVGFGRAARTLLFRVNNAQKRPLPPANSSFTAPLYRNPRKIPSNPLFPVSPCPIHPSPVLVTAQTNKAALVRDR